VERAIGAAACLVGALASSGAVAKAAFVLCFLASGMFLWSLVDYTGRRWFMHHVVFQEVIRPRPNLALELIDAMIRVERVASALQNPRCSESEGESGAEVAYESDVRHSAAYSAQDGDA
jgi:hypothetical protein